MQGNQFPSLFQAKSLELINDLIPVSGSVFFLVQPDMKHQGTYLSNAPSDIEKAYNSTYFAIDPLHPSLFKHSSERIVTLSAQISTERLMNHRYYLEFMQKYQHRYVLDMFFRNSRNEIIAVISLLRTQFQNDFTQQEIKLMHSVHSFMEYSLNSVYLPKRDQERTNLQARYSLTDRELDVLEMLILGASNKEIAKHIEMGLATLKTHLNHIFKKTAVQSRTELTAKIMSEL